MSCPLQSVNVTLFGKRVFADVVKWKIPRWQDYPGFSSWALNAITRVLIGEGQREIIRTHRGESDVATGTEMVVTSQRMPAATRRWKSEEKILSQRLQREVCACRHLDFRILASWTLREYISIVLSNPVCGNLLHSSQRKWVHPSFPQFLPSLLPAPCLTPLHPLNGDFSAHALLHFYMCCSFILDRCWNLTHPSRPFSWNLSDSPRKDLSILWPLHLLLWWFLFILIYRNL